MNILFITHHYLSSNGGGSFASRAYINAFAEIADEMTLLYPVKEGEDLFPEINKKIKAVPVAYDIPKWRKLLHLLEGKVHRYFKAAKDLFKAKRFDIVVFDTSLVSYRLIRTAKQFAAKTVVIHHNYQYEYFRDNAKGLLSIPTLFWCKRYEKEAVQNADLNLTLTRQDIDLLANNYNNGSKDRFSLLGTFEFKPALDKKITESSNCIEKFVITGSLGDVQTEQSLIPWLRHYYPILKESFPGASLTIAGKNPSGELKKACVDAGVNLIESPQNMDDILANADAYICPTCFGGGLKLRIMDGLKWGLPVVTHAVSARGYDQFIEEGIVIPYANQIDFRNALEKIKKTTISKEKIQEFFHQVFSFEAGLNRIKLRLSKFVM